MTFDPVQDYTTDAAAHTGFRVPSILLSASVPVLRGSTSEEVARSRAYLPARRSEIREAIVQLARFAFARNVQIVCGGHPAITPLLMAAAGSVPRSGGSSTPRLLVFQSSYFADVVPDTTVRLGNWEHARLVWTRSVGQPARKLVPEDRAVRDASLEWMRTQMVEVPTMVGAVFVGGMEGTEREAELVRQRSVPLPSYALKSTGGAAELLYDADPSGCRGRSTDPDIIEGSNMAAVARSIFQDLGIT